VGYERVAYPVEPLRNRDRGPNTREASTVQNMSSWDDDDDWTGTPPEGRHDASRANPDFWRDNRAPLSITGAGVGIALIILAIVLLV